MTAHEVGHILGLSHIYEKQNNQWVDATNSIKYDIVDTVMAYNYVKEQYYENQDAPKSLGIHDIAAIQYLYGANTSYNNGDTTYKYSYVPFYETIWDGGGIDTIDLSNFSLGSNLNLNNGTRSDIFFRPSGGTYAEHVFMGERALGIAYGANIENAKGTQGNDVIYGNNLDNVIWGENGNDTIYGGAGNDTIYGGAGNDILHGGEGADTLIGGIGNDIYYIDNINDTVIENMDEGFDAIYSSVGSNNALKYKNIEDFYLLEEGGKIGFIGNSLNNKIVGNSFDNELNGYDGDDILIGGKGDDRLVGGLGNDTFIFARGDGKDTIHLGSYNPNDIDTLQFDGAITKDQLWFTRKENYLLEISIIGTSDKVSVTNFFYDKNNILDQVKASGKTLTYDKIDQLVNAMAAFSPPALGQTTLPANYQQALTPVIAAAWS